MPLHCVVYNNGTLFSALWSNDHDGVTVPGYYSVQLYLLPLRCVLGWIFCF
eukprot:m.348942 g.348942  ORF g.348942 m.348942 type:complete len:51 (+) comp20683_c0_seq11:980-1132(+)